MNADRLKVQQSSARNDPVEAASKALEIASILLRAHAVDMDDPERNRLDVWVELENFILTVKILIRTEWGYLSAITGLDFGPEEDQIEVLYHFCAGDAVVTLRVRTPRNEPKVPTVCEIIPSASFFERELSEFFGVEVIGTPTRAALYLPDDWPEGLYPLRKDVDLQT